MVRRFALVGVFVIIDPGTVRQLAHATLLTVIYLAIQLTVSPFHSPLDDFMAVVCSLALTMLFVICLLYKFDALTQLEDVQAVMSSELQGKYLMSFVSFSGILSATCTSAFFALGAIALKVAKDQTMLHMRDRRLRFVNSHVLVIVPPEYEECKKRLHLIHGALYRKDSEGRVQASPLPTKGPFHVFLSHNWKHGQAKMRILEKALHGTLPRMSIFLGKPLVRHSLSPRSQLLHPTPFGRRGMLMHHGRCG